MLKLIKYNLPFVSVFLAFIAVVGSILLTKEKLEAHLWINHYYSDFFDYFFFYTTQIIEGKMAITILILVMLIKDFKSGLLILIAACFTSLMITGGLKPLFGHMRPIVHLPNLRLLPEFFHLKQNIANSFPSGHTTMGFTVFASLSIMAKNKNWGYLFGILAAIVGFSRVYLSQHFFEDIFVGAIIGTLGSFLIYFWLDRYSFGILSKYSLRGKK